MYTYIIYKHIILYIIYLTDSHTNKIVHKHVIIFEINLFNY